MNGLNKRRKGTSVSTFDFSILYSKLLDNTLLTVLNSLIDFCFGGRETKYIKVNSCSARWVENFKDNVVCFKKQQIKDAVAYLFSNCYFTVG